MARSTKKSVLALIEATDVTGPAKNLIRFAQLARTPSGDDGLSVDVTVATFERRRQPDGPPTAFGEAVDEAGIPLEAVDEARAFDLRVLGQLRDLVRRCSPDIIQSHGVKSHFLVRLSGVARSIPWLAFHHGYTHPDRKMAVFNQLDRWSLNGASHIVTVCQAFANDLRALGIRRVPIDVLHNSIEGPPQYDDERVAKLANELGLEQGRPVVVTVGRLSKEKGHEVLLEAAGIINRQSPSRDFVILLVGGGPEEGALRRLAESLKISDRVKFAGYRQSVGDCYRLATIMALPSFSEGSPNVLLEAMAAGVPSIATAVGGVVDVLEDEQTGLVVPSGNPPALAAALERLLTDRDARGRFSQHAKTYVTAHHRPSVYRDQLLSVYRHLLQRDH